MKVDFYMIFLLNAAQKLVAEHSVSDFYMISLIKHDTIAVKYKT